MIRDNYWVNFNFPNATLAQVFEFNRNPRLPVFSNWVVDFNAFFDTGVPVPVNNKARQDRQRARQRPRVAAGLHRDDGDPRAAQPAPRPALGLPSGQGVAKLFGMRAADDGPAARRACRPTKSRCSTPAAAAAEEDAALVLRPARGGGARTAATSSVRSAGASSPRRSCGCSSATTSYLNAGGFTPSLPSAAPALHLRRSGELRRGDAAVAPGSGWRSHRFLLSGPGLRSRSASKRASSRSLRFLVCSSTQPS